MAHSGFGRWLIPPPLSGRIALLFIAAALSMATAARAAIAPLVTGCEFTPYLPVVLLCAILLPWWQAVLVALVSIPVLGMFFVGTPQELLASSCFISSAGMFLAASTGIICLAALFRRMVHSLQHSGADESSGGVLFSLHEGEVWASWHGKGPRVLLGSETRVSVMMEDFLAQGEVAKRLNHRDAGKDV